LNLQLPPAASEVPQVLPLSGNVAPAPRTETLEAAAPPVLVIVTCCAALVLPMLTLPNERLVELGDNDAVAAAVPVPDSGMLMVAPPPVIVYVALSAVAAVGLYVKMTVQNWPGFSVALLHVPDLLNFAGAAGYDMLVAAPVPVFDTVIVCAPLVVPVATLPKASDGGVALTLGADAAWPVPEKLTATVLALVPNVYVALCAPAALGLNETVSVHDAPAASEDTVVHVPVAGNCPASLFVRVLIVPAALPVLVIVVDCDALVAPTASVPNESEGGVAE